MISNQLNLPWRQNVGMVILNDHGCVWMGRRGDASDYPWQFPQGGIHDGETPSQAMWRELCEETGIIRAEILAEHSDWLSYELPQELAERHGFRGQRQKWFLLRYSGTDNNIRTNEEFLSWAWIPCVDLKIVVQTVVVPFKRQVYANLLQNFNYWLG